MGYLERGVCVRVIGEKVDLIIFCVCEEETRGCRMPVEFSDCGVVVED